MNEKDILIAYTMGEISKSSAEAQTGLKKSAFNRRLNSLGFNTKDFDITKIGFKSKTDQQFWTSLHKEYLSGKETLISLNEKLGLRVTTIKERFLSFNLTLKEKKQRYEETMTKMMQTNLNIYGTEHALQSSTVQQKLKETVKTKYGVDNVFQLDEVKQKSLNSIRARFDADHHLQTKQGLEKLRETNQSKYGVDYVGQQFDVKAKIMETNISRYGGHPQQNSDVRRKTEQTCQERFGHKHTLASPQTIEKRTQTVKDQTASRLLPMLAKFGYEVQEGYQGIFEDMNGIKKQRRYSIKHTKCNIIFMDDLQLLPRCPTCFPLTGRLSSQLQTYYSDHIKELGFSVIDNYKDAVKSIKTNHWLEVDIFLKDATVNGMKIGFEFNNLYTHSLNHPIRLKLGAPGWNSAKTKDYHQVKTESGLASGVLIYHIWENVDVEIVKSKIGMLLGTPSITFGARELQFKEITHKDAQPFFKATHTHGGIPTSKLSYGLFLDSTLLSAISFRASDETTLEIARYSADIHTKISGGFSKLLKNAILHIKQTLPSIKTILTYADRDWTPDWKSSVYAKFGFNFHGDTGPTLFYTDCRKVYSRHHYQKYKLKALFPETYDEKLTEQQILALNKIYPFYNSGNWKFTLNI